MNKLNLIKELAPTIYERMDRRFSVRYLAKRTDDELWRLFQRWCLENTLPAPAENWGWRTSLEIAEANYVGRKNPSLSNSPANVGGDKELKSSMPLESNQSLESSPAFGGVEAYLK